MEPEQTWAGVEKIIEHFEYDGHVLNDIAILRLAQEVLKISSPYCLFTTHQVDLSLFSPVCIPPATVASSEEFAGQNATAVGWGALEYGSKPHIFFCFLLQKILTPHQPQYDPPMRPSYSPAGDYPDTLQELQDLLPIVAKADCVDDSG